MFGFLPHQFFTHHEGQSNSGLSPRLWRRVSQALMEGAGQTRLVLTGDDFLALRTLDTSTDIFSEMPYTSYIDTGGTLTQLADENGGVIALTTDGTDEDEIWLVAGDGTGPLGFISDTAGSDFITAFEARYKISTLVNAAMSHYVGLSSPAAAAADIVTDATGAFAGDAFIGFRTLLDGDAIDFVYKASGQTLVVPITGVKVPVADTFVKLGFIYDPTAPAAKRIKVFVDNVEQSTYVTAANIAAATFPDAEALTFRAGFKNTTAAAGELAMDWWSFAQVIRD